MTVLTGMELGSDDVVRLVEVPAWRKRLAALKSGESSK